MKRLFPIVGLAVLPILLAACTSAAAGAARPQPGQYRQATSTVKSESQASERETLRQEQIDEPGVTGKAKR